MCLILMSQYIQEVHSVMKLVVFSLVAEADELFCKYLVVPYWRLRVKIQLIKMYQLYVLPDLPINTPQIIDGDLREISEFH